MAPAKLASARPASRVTVRLARRPAMATRPAIETSAPRMPATGTANDVDRSKAKRDDQRSGSRSGLWGAEQRRFGKRVAQEPLQRSAGQPERRADQRGEQSARQADVAHDDAGRAFAREQAGDRGARRQPRRADHQ